MARHPKVKDSGGWNQEALDWGCIVGEGSHDRGDYRDRDNLRTSG